jgi:hypothetical protein
LGPRATLPSTEVDIWTTRYGLFNASFPDIFDLLSRLIV